MGHELSVKPGDLFLLGGWAYKEGWALGGRGAAYATIA